MAKTKQHLTRAQKRARKAAKKARREKFETVFMNGKQVRIRRPPTVDGVPADQFIAEHADPIWLHQNEMWEMMPSEDAPAGTGSSTDSSARDDDDM